MPKVTRRLIRQPDGRAVYLYGEHAAAPQGYQSPERPNGAYERRWNPLRAEWVLVAAARQDRTFLPGEANCPLCPSTPAWSSEIPAGAFEMAVFDNRFPSMPNGHGACEVVVYTEKHDAAMATLSERQMSALVDVWIDRYRGLASRPDVKYVYIFENRGEAVGVTLDHPHGQIYGYPFVPPVAETELRAGREHARRIGGCLQCSLVNAELGSAERTLFMDQGIAAYVPAYARWPYEAHVAPVKHAGALPDLASVSRQALGAALQRVARAYDRLFNEPMPYVMAMHQRPTDGESHPEAHIHVEFYPVRRAAARLKYLAGGECGAGTFVSDGLPEQKAAELRELI